MFQEQGFSGHPPLQGLAERFIELYAGCRVSSLVELAGMSRRVHGLYPEYFPDGNFTGYSNVTFCKLLNAQRKGLPEPRLVDVVVLSCLAIGKDRGVFEGEGVFAGVSVARILADFRQYAAKAEQRAADLGLFVRRGFRSAVRPERVPRFRPATAPWRGRAVPSRELLAREAERLSEYGPYAEVVIGRLGQGDPEACYQSALLLSAWSEEDEQDKRILQLFTDAAAANHAEALGLLQECRPGLNRVLAQQCAHALAAEAARAGYLDATEAFADCVGRLKTLNWEGMPLAAPVIQAEPPA